MKNAIIPLLLSTLAFPANASTPTLTGLDVLAKQNFAPLRGKNIGLITNHTGLSLDGKRNLDLMIAAGVKVVALFSPEHGFAGVEDRRDNANSLDKATGLTVYSLHNNGQYRMTPEMLKGVDTIVYDIQDVGARFYTYSCTLAYGIEEAARLKLPFYVLDRPNPITGDHVEGPVIDRELESFVGCLPVPIRHGMTFGELARFVNGERQLGADLHVIQMEGWRRSEWFDETNLPWVDPSPNMNSLTAATLYTGTCLLEQTREFSVGRGTKAAYEQVGADWLDGRKLAAFMNERRIRGVSVYPVRMRPAYSHYQDKEINGVRFLVTDRNAINAVRLGLEMIYALQTLYPGKVDIDINRRLIGNAVVIAALKARTDPAKIEKDCAPAIEKYLQTREKYLLYSR